MLSWGKACPFFYIPEELFVPGNNLAGSWWINIKKRGEGKPPLITSCFWSVEGDASE